MIWLCGFIQAIAESRSRQADIYLKHLIWQPITNEGVECVNTPEKKLNNS